MLNTKLSPADRESIRQRWASIPGSTIDQLMLMVESELESKPIPPQVMGVNVVVVSKFPSDVAVLVRDLETIGVIETNPVYDSRPKVTTEMIAAARGAIARKRGYGPHITYDSGITTMDYHCIIEAALGARVRSADPTGVPEAGVPIPLYSFNNRLYDPQNNEYYMACPCLSNWEFRGFQKLPVFNIQMKISGPPEGFEGRGVIEIVNLPLGSEHADLPEPTKRMLDELEDFRTSTEEVRLSTLGQALSDAIAYILGNARSTPDHPILSHTAITTDKPNQTDSDEWSEP